MPTIYTEAPLNFDDIKDSVLVEKDVIAEEILMADKVFFYDACSFRKHLHLNSPEKLFEFIKQNGGIVVVTRGILMELASHSGVLNAEYIDFIKAMKNASIKIMIVYEEDLFEVMNKCFSTNETINDYLSWAVKVVKHPTSTIEKTLKSDKNLSGDILNRSVSNGNLYKRFFSTVRNNKETGDNLGEELMAICFHFLANIPEVTDYKYVIMTDDKGAIGLINKAAKNAYNHVGKNMFSALTTARIAQRLYEEKIITDKEQIVDVLSIISTDGMIKIFGSEEYDLSMREKTMSCDRLAELIETPGAIHINY